jgi:hypothetical protein
MKNNCQGLGSATALEVANRVPTSTPSEGVFQFFVRANISSLAEKRTNAGIELNKWRQSFRAERLKKANLLPFGGSFRGLC